MIRNKRIALLIATVLLISSLGLTGCRQEDTKTPVAPETTKQQLLPMFAGDDQSPLPTPGTDQSPLQP